MPEYKAELHASLLASESLFFPRKLCGTKYIYICYIITIAII